MRSGTPGAVSCRLWDICWHSYAAYDEEGQSYCLS